MLNLFVIYSLILMYFYEDRMYLNLVKTVGSELRDMSMICTTHGLDT